MKSYTVTKLGESRGRPRIWIEGQRPAGGGVMPGEDRRAARHAAQKCGEELLGVLGVGTAVQRQR